MALTAHKAIYLHISLWDSLGARLGCLIEQYFVYLVVDVRQILRLQRILHNFHMILVHVISIHYGLRHKYCK
jgi:hypothetical protein